MIRELPIPPDSKTAEESVEIFRGWLIDGCFQCSLFPSAFSDPAVWGMLLADAAHHIANALADTQHVDRQLALTAMLNKFVEEMQSPTAEHSGNHLK